MASKQTFPYRWTSNSLPIGTHTAKKEGSGIVVAGQKDTGWVLFIEGAPDPQLLPLPPTFTVRVVSRVAAPTAGGGGGQGKSGKGGKTVGSGAKGGDQPAGPDPSKSVPPAAARGTTTTGAPTEAARVPVIAVTELKQIDQLKARGLVEAKSVDEIKAKPEKDRFYTFDQAMKLLDGLDRLAAPSGEKRTSEGRDSWLKWAKFAEENREKISGQSKIAGRKGLTVEEVKEIIAKHKEYVGVKDAPPPVPGQKLEYDPEKRKGWRTPSFRRRIDSSSGSTSRSTGRYRPARVRLR